MKENVLLFNPPLYYSNGHPHTLDESVPPLGLVYLASYINYYCDDIKTYVCDVGPEKLSLFNLNIIEDKKPIAIGLSSMTPQLQGCVELARIIKKYYSHIPIFLGGSHVSADPDFVNRHSNLFDYAIIGEAEKTFLNSIKSIQQEREIPKIQQSELIYEIDTIPYPDRKLINRKKYSQRESMIFSRGCPYQCYYCSRPAISTKVRYRSPDNLLGEMESVYQYCNGKIDFQDDTFTINRGKVLELCERIVDVKLRLDWYCNTRLDLVDEELLFNMSRAGCGLIHFGIESGDEKLRRELILKGNLTNDRIKEVFKICKKFKIKVGGYFMIGHPNETFEDIAKTKRFILYSDIDLLGISVPTPFPGSRLYDLSVQDGIISKEFIDDFAGKKYGEGYTGNYPVYINRSLLKEEIFRIRKEIIRKFYLRPAIIFGFLKDNITSLSNLKKIFIDALYVIFKGSSKRQPYIYKNIRIVIVTPFFAPNIGGLETHLKYYTDFLASKNIETTILTYKPLTTYVKNWLKFEKNNSIEIHRYWWWGKAIFDKLAKYPLLEFFYMVPKLFFHVSIYTLLHRKNIRVFHAHGLIAAFIVRIITIFIKRKKIVSTHYIYNLRNRIIFTKIFLWIFNGFDRVLAVGEESKRNLVSTGYPEEKTEIYKHSIDNQWLFTIMNKVELRKRYSFNSSDTIVLFVGRLIEMKGIKKIVNIACLNRDIKFVFVGSGELAQYLEDNAKRYTNISYLGVRSGKELAEIYNISDMVILPSTEEGSSLVIIEALSCGKPVIVTNKGCSKDMFSDELGRKIIPTEENIIMAIRELQKENIDLLADKCRTFALSKYGVDNLQKILDSYS